MSKRKWIVLSCALLVLLLYGARQTVLTADSKVDKYTASCETMDEQMENDITYMMDFFNEEDFDGLTDRVNELVPSTEMIEDELSVLETASCLDELYKETLLRAYFNGYHSLLVFVLQMIEEEEIQFKEITFTAFERDGYLQVEGILKNKKEHIEIDHYYGYDAMDSYLTRDVRLTKEKLREMEENPPPLILTISEGIASIAFQALQNPIEKFMASVNSFFTGKAELEQEIFEKESLVNASYFNMNYSVITSKENAWDPVRMVEYYPSRNTYSTLERAKQVHEELPGFFYPKEEIKRGDWNGIIAYYENHQQEMRRNDGELYDYIFSNVLHDSESFEELIQKVKDHHGIE